MGPTISTEGKAKEAEERKKRDDALRIRAQKTEGTKRPNKKDEEGQGSTRCERKIGPAQEDVGAVPGRGFGKNREHGPSRKDKRTELAKKESNKKSKKRGIREAGSAAAKNESIKKEEKDPPRTNRLD